MPRRASRKRNLTFPEAKSQNWTGIAHASLYLCVLSRLVQVGLQERVFFVFVFVLYCSCVALSYTFGIVNLNITLIFYSDIFPKSIYVHKTTQMKVTDAFKISSSLQAQSRWPHHHLSFTFSFQNRKDSKKMTIGGQNKSLYRSAKCPQHTNDWGVANCSAKIEECKKCRLGLSLNYVRGPLRRCLDRNMVFHRFDHATHGLDATTLVQPIEAKSWSRIDFSLFQSKRSMPQCIAVKACSPTCK